MRSLRSLATGGAVAATVVTAMTVGGCSVAGTTFHPGVAAQVGDTTVTSRDVDRLATATCAVFGPQLEESNQVIPLRYLKGSVVQALALGAAVRQFGTDHGVTPSAQYTREVDANTNSAGDIPPDQVEAVVLLRTSTTLINDVLGQVGAQVAADTEDESTKGAAPAPASEQAQTIGGQAFGQWLDDHEVEVDPQYDVRITSGGPDAVDTSISFPVGVVAKAGAAGEPDQAQTMTLPASQRCGSYDESAASAGSGGAG